MIKQGLSNDRSKLIYSTIFDLALLAVIFTAFYTVWLGSYPLFIPDEGRYSEVAREMVFTGDYITPRLNGIAFFDKPIMYYWLQASAIKIFGLHEAALRFWPATIGILGCLMVYLAGRVLFDRRTGYLSALILATTTLYFSAAHYANLDLEVAVFISCSLLLFIMGIKFSSLVHEQKYLQSLCFMGAYFFAGIAFLTKGAIGLAFPIMIIGTWTALLWRWDVLLKIKLIPGLMIFALVALPWYILVQQANPEFFHFFFVTQQLTRYVSGADFNNKTAFWFYFPLVFAGFLPWSLFMLQALGKSINDIWRNKQQHSTELFLLLWVVIIFTFFSIPKSKTIGYILPILPALALVVGHFLSQHWEQAQQKLVSIGTVSYIIIAGVIAAILLALPQLNLIPIQPSLTKFLYFSAVLYLGSALLISVFIRQKQLATVFCTLTFTMVLCLLTLTLSACFINTKSIKPIAYKLKPILQPNDEIVAFYKYQQDYPLYLEKYIHVVADWQAKDIPNRDNWVREFWYGMDFKGSKAGKHLYLDESTFWKHWFSSKRVYVLLHHDEYKEFFAKAKQRHYLFDQNARVAVVSNHPTLGLTENP